MITRPSFLTKEVKDVLIALTLSFLPPSRSLILSFYLQVDGPGTGLMCTVFFLLCASKLVCFEVAKLVREH